MLMHATNHESSFCPHGQSSTTYIYILPNPTQHPLPNSQRIHHICICTATRNGLLVITSLYSSHPFTRNPIMCMGPISIWGIHRTAFDQRSRAFNSSAAGGANDDVVSVICLSIRKTYTYELHVRENWRSRWPPPPHAIHLNPRTTNISLIFVVVVFSVFCLPSTATTTHTWTLWFPTSNAQMQWTRSMPTRFDSNSSSLICIWESCAGHVQPKLT